MLSLVFNILALPIYNPLTSYQNMRAVYSSKNIGSYSKRIQLRVTLLPETTQETEESLILLTI